MVDVIDVVDVRIGVFDVSLEYLIDFEAFVDYYDVEGSFE